MAEHGDSTGQRLVLVTGAARGIGLACARRFAEAGDRVVLTDRDDEACALAAQSLGPGHIAVCMDVSAERDVVRVMEDVQSRCGPLDVLVNNAGVVDRFARPLLDVPAEDIERLISINLQGPFLVTRAAIPAMAARGRGAIINIASGAGLRALPGRAAYGMTKAGVIGMTRALAVELAPLGIAVNAVLPGYVDTEILLALEREGRFDRESVARAIPAGRLGRGHEIAEAVFHLSHGGYLAGTLLSVDGGVDAFGGSGRASARAMPQRMHRTGDVACVTGGASGIGAAIADHLAGQGWQVVVLDQQPVPGNRFPSWQVDLADQRQVDDAFATIATTLAPVALLVNNAGVVEPLMPSADQRLADFLRTVDVNVAGMIHAARAAALQMREHGGGAIINLSSITASLGVPGRNAYCASKSATTMLTRSMACEWAEHGIRVNAVAPGYVRTPALEALIDAGVRDMAAITARIPMGRLGQPSEIAALVAFLASDAASYITGTTVQADGGYLASGHPPGAPMP